ncbi:lipase 3 isoform X2 [Nasonia vitripennis]|uniref:Lipase n=1 Tax=Nasonia vitripennis TaxID=7425 RepID=A0A7M7QB77_NASVI|nr:lipase 3 isoform X2 [Nasonia vitripennis]
MPQLCVSSLPTRCKLLSTGPCTRCPQVRVTASGRRRRSRKETSTFILDLSPAKFARERYERSRNKTTARTFTPVPNYVQAVDFVSLVNRHGYPGEEHVVMTADGYLLRIHRIPGSPSRPRAVGKPVIYMQHGLLASSDTWVLMGPQRDLAYILADAGYDVWLGNVRGNTYSRAHVSLSPDYDPAFWEFSYHEIALYDVTAVIDYILIKTAQPSLVYIGHSMGTTISYILLSIKPEYNKKIRLLVSLAPVAFWHAPPRAFVRFLIDNTEAIKSFVTNARIYELFPLTAANAQLAKTTCSDGSIFQQLCMNFVYYSSGYNPEQLNASEVSYVLSYFPAGTSAQTLIHFSQNMRTGDFQMYDHGFIRNLATYKQRQPPMYNLSNIISPVGLFYGKGDALVSPGNPIELSQKLPNVLTIEAVPDEKFSHLDFLWSTDIRKLLNDRIFEFISKTLRQQNSAL